MFKTDGRMDVRIRWEMEEEYYLTVFLLGSLYWLVGILRVFLWLGERFLVLLIEFRGRGL